MRRFRPKVQVRLYAHPENWYNARRKTKRRRFINYVHFASNGIQAETSVSVGEYSGFRIGFIVTWRVFAYV